MENASKALIIAAGVLIGILVLSLAVFLFMDFGARSKDIYAQVELNQLTQYNSQYTVYNGRSDITIYDIITLCNLAKENNDTYKEYTNFESEYKVIINLSGTNFNYLNAQDLSTEEKQKLISEYNGVESNGELTNQFKCEGITFHDTGGKVNKVTIKRIK